jgi:hypothetical protein
VEINFITNAHKDILNRGGFDRSGDIPERVT